MLCGISLARATDDKPAQDLVLFCKKWMGFLEQRERDNRAAIRWESGPDGVRGEFVGYSTEHTCLLKEATKTRIAKIKYRQYLYQHTGSSAADALSREPRVIQITKVHEIFRYTNGKWVY